MDQLDSNVYNGLKESIRRAVKNIANDNTHWSDMPIILVDYRGWEVVYFENETSAIQHIKKTHVDGWDEPPSGEDDELVLIKFCTQYQKERWDSLYGKYKFYKEINGKKIYREKTCVSFEPELIINVHI